jgi:hypothetical protein
MKKKKIGNFGLMEISFIALCGEMEQKFVKNGKKKVRVGNPKPNIHNKTCKSCFKSLYLFCFIFYNFVNWIWCITS